MFFQLEMNVINHFAAKDIDSALLLKAYGAWQSLKNEGLPRKCDLDMRPLQDLLGNLALIGFEGKEMTSGKRPKYMMVGGNLTSILGKDVSDHYIDEVYKGPLLEKITKSIDQVFSTKEPHYSVIRWRTLRRRVGYDRLLLPLFNDDGEVESIMAVFSPSDHNIVTRQDWEKAEDVQQMRHFMEDIQKIA